MKFCACIDTLYTELPWERRFSVAARDGFDAVEFWDWRIRHTADIQRLAEDAGIAVSGFNGDADFSLIVPEQRTAYLDFLERSLETAKEIGAASVTIHSNALGEGGIVVNAHPELSDTIKLCSMYEGLQEAVKLADEYDVQLNLEGLNVWVDHVGNFLKNTQMAAELIGQVRSPRLKILYDVYHMQINEGNICDTLSHYIDSIGHIHVADVPGRHEPGTGEINYQTVFTKLEELHYDGYIGFELFPLHTSEEAVRAIMSYKS